MNKRGGIVFGLLGVLSGALFIAVLLGVLVIADLKDVEYPEIPCNEAREALSLGIGLENKYTIDVTSNFILFNWTIESPLTNEDLKRYYLKECLK